MTPVSKRATNPGAFARRSEWFSSARSAFKALLVRMGVPDAGAVLLPAYIGWSPREGSGVFDPIAELGAEYLFYRVTPQLQIDLEDLRVRLSGGRVKVVVLIHYFGYPDPSFQEAAGLARSAGAFVVEDEAHALFTDLVGGLSGRTGDAALFSLHKMLPVDAGGLLVATDRRWLPLEAHTIDSHPNPWDYDLAGIASARRENAAFLIDALGDFAEVLTPLRPDLEPGIVPQTFPVLLTSADRNQVYDAMNGQGFGVVSLYHTLVGVIDPAAYPDSYDIARCVLNLPVHQDTSPDQLRELVDALGRCLRRQGR